MRAETEALADALAAGLRVGRGLTDLAERLQRFGPLDGKIVDGFDDQAKIECDALLKRYEQYFELYSKRVFRLILVLSGEDTTGFSARDAYNRLESLGAIKNSDAWLSFGLIRNKLAHEYPISSDKQAERLNEALMSAKNMVRASVAAELYVEDRGLLKGENE